MINHLYDVFKHWSYTNGINKNSIYFYSDPHFGDPDVAFFRCLNNVSDEEQIKRINRIVQKHDTIIFLGDIGNTDFIKKIHGYKVLICGNHDKGASNYLRSETFIRGFDSVLEAEQAKKSGEINHWRCSLSESRFIDGFIDNHLFDEVYEGPLVISEKLIISHEPIDSSYFYNIHGHVHRKTMNDENHFNVCAENINYTPISLKYIIEAGALKKVTSLHRDTIDQATERANRK